MTCSGLPAVLYDVDNVRQVQKVIWSKGIAEICIGNLKVALKIVLEEVAYGGFQK